MIEELKLIKESLSELIPDPEIDFGPAYEMTHQRKREALRIINKLIREQSPPTFTITAESVKHLRDLTDMPMMECKKALTACEGDMNKAIEWIRVGHRFRTYL